MGAFAHNLEMLTGEEAAGGFGPWRMLQGMNDPTIQVDGIVTGDEVIVWVSNDKESPTNSHQAGSNITADGIVEIDEGPRWIRLELDADAGGGTVVARLAGHEYA